MDIENILLILGLSLIIAGVFLLWGLETALIISGIMFVFLAFLLARGKPQKSENNRG